ncbi:hypothetical protein ACTXG7_05380 [Mycolicibacterium sp. Dal123E01]|uniref:hypothetical protein n=1 Tax=Mycolicibacterium sp. Dal123E01 TaxID=3457578 RepID=UPI00403EEEE6
MSEASQPGLIEGFASMKELLEQVRTAQQSAADSLDRSADSHDRLADSYDGLASSSAARDDYGLNARRHRQFAFEDRRIAGRLRRMAAKRTG